VHQRTVLNPADMRWYLLKSVQEVPGRVDAGTEGCRTAGRKGIADPKGRVD
jgi:hypothetical protein